MDIKSVALIAGIMFMATFWKEAQCKHKCEQQKTSHGTSSAVCSNINIDTIPRDMDSPPLEELIISKLKLVDGEIQEGLFQNYRNLKKLEIADIQGKSTGKMSLHKSAFFHLKKLEDLTLKNVLYDENENPDYLWPSSLQTLELIKIGLQNLVNTISLGELRYLDISSNNLTTFPILNKTAPLTSITMNNNPIDMIEVKQIAPFCQLTSVGMEFGSKSQFANDKVCDCFRLFSWLKKENIRGLETMKCGIFTNSPSAIQTGNNQCKNASSFTDEELNLFKECRDRLPGSSVMELLLYALFFAFLFPIGYFANEYFNRYTSRETDNQVAGGPPKRALRLMGFHCGNSSPSEYDFEEGCLETEHAIEEEE